jgi:hypothetical protein
VDSLNCLSNAKISDAGLPCFASNAQPLKSQFMKEQIPNSKTMVQLVNVHLLYRLKSTLIYSSLKTLPSTIGIFLFISSERFLNAKTLLSKLVESLP